MLQKIQYWAETVFDEATLGNYIPLAIFLVAAIVLFALVLAILGSVRRLVPAAKFLATAFAVLLVYGLVTCPEKVAGMLHGITGKIETFINRL